MDRRVLRAEGRRCPSCGHDKLWHSGDDRWVRAVCENCGTCWDRTAEPWTDIDSVNCPGCSEARVCESRPTAAARDHTIRVTLPGGSVAVIRLLLHSDRTELRDSYEELSDSTRRLRFFLPPKRLSPSHLEYLTNLDYDRRFALVAFEQDDDSEEGLGVARWFRSQEDPTRAEAAVVVKDEHHGRGLGSALLRALVDEAVSRGITTFTADVLWDNRKLLGDLEDLGATVSPGEAGVATVQIRLPDSGAGLPGTALHQALVVAAQDS